MGFQEVLAVGDDGVVVFQFVVGHVGIVQEGQFAEVVERRHGALPEGLPVFLQGEVLDIGGRLSQAFRVLVGRFPEPGAGLGLAPGRVIITAGGGQEAAVGGVRLQGFRHETVEPFPVQLQDFGVQAPHHVAQVHVLGGGGDVLGREERVQGLEIVLVTAHVPIDFGHAQDGGDITAVQREGFRVAGLRQGVGEIGQVVVSEHGQDGGGGILGVEFFQLLHALFLPSHGAQDIVAGAHHFFRQAPLPLDFRERGQRLVVLFLGQVDIQQFVHDGVFVREGFHERFVLPFPFIDPVLGQIHAAQQAAVPVIGAVQGDGLLEGGFGLLRVRGLPLRLREVIPDGVVPGGGFGKRLQDVPGADDLAVPIERHRIDEIAFDRLADGRGHGKETDKQRQGEFFHTYKNRGNILFSLGLHINLCLISNKFRTF